MNPLILFDQKKNANAHCLNFSNANKVIIIVEGTGLFIYNLDLNSIDMEILVDCSVTSLAISIDDKYVISGGGYGMDSRIWDLENLKSEVIFREMYINDVMIYNDSLALLVKQDYVYSIDYTSKKLTEKRKLNNKSKLKRFEPKHKFLTSLFNDTFILYQCGTKLKKIIDFKIDGEKIVGALALSQETVFLLLAKGEILILKNGISELRINLHESVYYGEGNILSCNQKEEILAVYIYPQIYLIDLKSNTIIKTIKTDYKINSMHFNKADNLILSNAYSQVISYSI